MKIKVDYIARVEGEGSVKFDIKNKTLRSLKLNIWEPPRFFEGFLVGRKFDEVPDIVSRICGICPVSHMSTAIHAIEKAMGLSPSSSIRKIRRIMALSQIVASHLVHLYILALPDYFKAELLSGHEREIKRLMRLKEALNSVTAAFGGRPLHPVSMVIGGFTKIPSRNEAGRLIRQLEAVRDDAHDTVKMISELSYPDFKITPEYVALNSKDEYAINEGTISTDSGVNVEIDDYLSFFKETEVLYSNAKRTMLKGKGAIMVGALPRLNIKFNKLHTEAKKAAKMIGFNPVENNPFMNNTAQAIEIVHGIWECIELLDSLETENHLINAAVKEGSGAAATEAPRGLLYHYYEVNKRGIIEKANIVTPTSHNSLGLEKALKKLVNENIDKPEKELTLLCEMLVRAYDPCFSCSVH
jgi:coenzyme F420-reducing hydrogenase alpha subunit